MALLYRDVLAIAKRLSRERSEISRDMAKLYDATLELHDSMTMEIQVLVKENNDLKKAAGQNDGRCFKLSLSTLSLILPCSGLRAPTSHPAPVCIYAGSNSNVNGPLKRQRISITGSS